MVNHFAIGQTTDPIESDPPVGNVIGEIDQ